MAADDKASDERHQSRSLERDRGKHRRRHRFDSPSPPKQRCKRSRSPGAQEKHRHTNSSEKHEDSTGGHELSNRSTEGMSEEDHGREVARKNSVEDDEKAGARKRIKEDRKVELHSSGDSSEDAYSDSESDRGRKKKKKKSRNKNYNLSRKSKSKHHRHVRSESEQDESQTEGTSGESSEDSEDEYRRAKRRRRLKQKEKAERERRRRKKEKKRKMKEKEREHEKRKKKKEKVEKQAKGLITDDDEGDCLEGDNMLGEGSNVDPILDPKHKIFLSHSGAQKEFVDHLCKALEDRWHYPFFDRRHESLPKGERFPKLIIQAAKQCEMLIVVMSNEYFMSKWPMIELSTFVKAHKLQRGSNFGPKILPLFYGLSVIGEKIEGIGILQKYKVKVVGIYGVGGIGKTMACKTLCNELSSKYEGRVCHIEFPNDSKELFRKALQDWTRKSMEFIQQLNEGECKNILRESLCKQRTFLAIDNISDIHESIQQAKSFLEVPNHMDSLVVLTARSQATLELLGLHGDSCLEMPDLGEANAMNLFLHHATSSKQFFEDGEKHDVMTCVKRCYFSKGNGQGHDYHPLALKALGLQLGCHGDNPSLWMKHLPRVRAFNFIPGENPIFDILRSSFDLLPLGDQTLFMDVGCFLEFYKCLISTPYIEWLCVVHNQDEEEIAHRLDHLKRKGLLQNVDLRSRRISMHEFAKLEAMGSFNDSTSLKDRMWVYIKNNDLAKLESKPEGGCWSKLIRVTLIQSSLDYEKQGQFVGWIGGMEGIKWDYFSNVEVLQLSNSNGGHEVLNLEGLPCLRILELADVNNIDRIEGLENLKRLIYFKWNSFSSIRSARFMGQLPSSLKRLIIYRVRVVFGLDLLARCHNLFELQLYGVEACTLDLSNCRSLEIVVLWSIWKLQTLSGFNVNQPSNLQSLEVSFCKDLVDVPRIDHLMSLKKLRITNCDRWKVPNLCAPTKLEVLSIIGEQRFIVCGKDCFPHQLQELQWSLGPLSSRFSEVWNLTGFNQLEVLNLNGRHGLTSLTELGDLPALRCLNLQHCEYLMQLPNLGMSRNLKELNVNYCSALELHEKDIQMLSELPLLQPVPFSGQGEYGKFSLDLARGKVKIRPLNWKEDEWEERDLGAPPIKIGRCGTWE